MEKVVIDEKFRIEKDFNNFTLVLEEDGEINESTGKPIHRVERWYCSTLKSALNRYLSQVVLEDISNINDVLDRLDEIEDKINKLKFK